jgi:predicted acyltransferase
VLFTIYVQFHTFNQLIFLPVKQRFYSLDVFRGATVALMILVNNPGSWAHIFQPLDHAPWHGLTPTDLVFPFFLFAVGNALSFVMPRLREAGDGMFWKKVIKRSLLIYFIGLFLTWWPFFQWSGDHLVFKHWVEPADPLHPTMQGGVRILGVLARIAICYFLASIIIYYLKPRGAFYAGLVILLAYWVLCFVLGNPADPYSMTGYFGNKVDQAILHFPHMYKGEGIPFDPEGLMSTLPAIVQVIFGYLVGDYIQNRSKADPGATPKYFEMLSGLFVIGVALLFTGFCWDMVFPINKKIWTSSYVVYTTGLAIITIGTMIYLIEVKKIRGWLSRFFDVFGKNALFVFALSAFLPKILWLIRIPNGMKDGKQVYTDPWHWYYLKVCSKIPGDPRIGSLAFAISFIFIMWLICRWLDKKKIYIKV